MRRRRRRCMRGVSRPPTLRQLSGPSRRNAALPRPRSSRPPMLHWKPSSLMPLQPHPRLLLPVPRPRGPPRPRTPRCARLRWQQRPRRPPARPSSRSWRRRRRRSWRRAWRRSRSASRRRPSRRSGVAWRPTRTAMRRRTAWSASECCARTRSARRARPRSAGLRRLQPGSASWRRSAGPRRRSGPVMRSSARSRMSKKSSPRRTMKLCRPCASRSRSPRRSRALMSWTTRTMTRRPSSRGR
mmetsp:Transcript_124248/g.322780  ORF Transcript_124248/g.322780 Transcript_124248/m.322780 type:complete len:242 (+) Transcript_124248:449-1174(+)